MCIIVVTAHSTRFRHISGTNLCSGTRVLKTAYSGAQNAVSYGWESNTVKLLYKDHPRYQQNVGLIHRWSLCKFNNMENIPCRPVKCGLYIQVHVLFTADFTVPKPPHIVLSQPLFIKFLFVTFQVWGTPVIVSTSVTYVAARAWSPCPPSPRRPVPAARWLPCL